MKSRIVIITLNVLLTMAGLISLIVGIWVCFDRRVVNISPFVVVALVGGGIVCLCADFTREQWAAQADKESICREGALEKQIKQDITNRRQSV